MTEPFNPFASWLGLDPKIKNPHHFQLLGLSSRVTDPVEIQKTVDAAVKRHAERLALVPAGENDELVDKLKHRIANARKTLLDPALRSAYLEKLKQFLDKNQPTTVSGLTLAQPPSDSTENVMPPDSAQLPSNASLSPANTASDVAAAIPKDPDTPMPLAIVAGATPPTHGIAGESPVATLSIPMAVPINEAAPNAPATAPNPPLATPEKNRGVAVNFDGVPIDEVRITKRPLARKHSNLVPILTIVMLALLGAGGVLIFQNWDDLARLGGIGENIPAAPGIVQEDELTTYIPTSPNPNTKVTNAEKKLPELNLNDLPDVNIDEIVERPQASVGTPRLPENENARLARIKERLAEMGRAETSARLKGKPESGVDATAFNPSAESKNTANPDSNFVELDQSQLVRLRRHIERAQRSIYRREKSAAARLLQSAEGVLEEVRKNVNDSFAPESAAVVRMVADTKEVFELVGGFWDQVVASCQRIPGGQEIRIGEQVVALIEADPEKFIVRNAGSNITYRYHFCPPGLAMALAAQGAIPDIPTWSKQQAAFYAVDQLGGANHQSEIEACLRIAEEANHDCSGIRRYCEFELSTVGIPPEKLEIGLQNEFDDALVDFRTKHDYADPEQLDPSVAGKLAESLLYSDSSNFQQRFALIEEARKLAIRGGEVSKAEDAVIELDHFAKIDRANLMCDSLMEISKGKLTQKQRRALMERAIPFLKSDYGGMAKSESQRSLTKQLIKMAESNGMTDAIRRLNQLD